MYFHQKLVVYYILDYFGILFILDINSVLIEFILWDQRLLKGFIFEKYSEGLKVLLNYICSALNFALIFVNKY